MSQFTVTSDKPAVQHVALAEPPKPTSVFHQKTHFKKWWWAHLIALITCVLVITVPLIYVAYPNIAQNDIDDSTLSISELTISNPSPNGFQLYQNQIIGTDSIFHPKVYQFDAEVGLAGESFPFAAVSVPEITARDNTATTVQQWVKLSNNTEFTDFAIAARTQETFGLSIHGKPKLKLGGLPTITVKYDKVVTMKGLNKLEGFKVISMELGSNLPNGNNAKDIVYIPNPSVMTLSMGNLTMDLSTNDTFLGQSTINNLVLKPGNNTVPMLSTLDQDKLLGLLGQLPEGTYTIPLTIVGNSSVYDGQDIPYFTAALLENTMHIDLDILGVLGG